MKRQNIIPFILIVLFLSCSVDKNFLPENLSGLRLKKKIAGKDAREFVDRLHFQQVASERNEIGFYEGGNGSAIVYVTVYKDEESASKDEKRMTGKISPENSVFAGGKYISIGGKNVYRCFGMGQSHFVFSHSNSLFWISAESSWGRDFVSAYLNHISN